MDLDQQLQTLIDEAPDDGMTADAVRAIAPTLKAIAMQLKHGQYYILQTLDQNWVMTALSNRNQPENRKNIVYAYCTLQDVASGPHSVKDPQVMALPLPVTHILFQMLALKPIDSIIFFDTPGNVRKGIEVRRQDVQSLLQTQLQHPSSGQVPSDMA
ncbi:hypothetical protein XM38_039310 [Halomicronema hongdechloris C2206]|uniref:Uncharacterized protein n=1 Tax=Halomicronema hongdechloris C2206 TaxID=1641165 RepID=A0A1Z3HRN1_9CYAN|nr:hypothetical protein [Halomicronema hongdechloris]ASC72970.1 hypothetical protein XM38_039310 [Halomicronema hongdechloris C2206]